MGSEPLYLLCGVLCDREVWTAQAAALGRDHDVRVLSFQGFDSLVKMAEHVLADAPARFALAGHSMGGRVALEVYRLAPERVSRLALLDTGFEAVTEGEAARRYRLVNRALNEGISSVAEDWARPMVGRSNQQDEELMNRILTMVGRMSGDIYAGHTQALLNRPDATPVLSTIRCPTLVLCGEEDTWSPPEQHQRMANMIEGAQVRLIPFGGHMIMMERPEAVTAALREWLKS